MDFDDYFTRAYNHYVDEFTDHSSMINNGLVHVAGYLLGKVGDDVDASLMALLGRAISSSSVSISRTAIDSLRGARVQSSQDLAQSIDDILKNASSMIVTFPGRGEMSRRMRLFKGETDSEDVSEVRLHSAPPEQKADTLDEYQVLVDLLKDDNSFIRIGALSQLTAKIQSSALSASDLNRLAGNIVESINSDEVFSPHVIGLMSTLYGKIHPELGAALMKNLTV